MERNVVEYKAIFALVFLTTFALAPAQAKDEPIVPVQIGSVEDLDACLSLGAVLENGSETLKVHVAPSASSAHIDSLAGGTRVYLCSVSRDGAWHGVVYPSEPDQECGVSAPVKEQRQYTGPCKSGWVQEKGIEVIAG